MSRPSFSNRNSYVFSNHNSQISTPNLPQLNASPFLPPIIPQPNLSYRKSVDALPRIVPTPSFIPMPFPQMQYMQPEMMIMPQNKNKYDLVKGIERVIDAIDQQSNLLQGFAKALNKKKEDRERDQTRHMKKDIAKIKRVTLEHQRKVDSQQETLFKKLLSSHELNGRSSKNVKESDSSDDESLDRLTNAVYTHRIKTILRKKKKKYLQQAQQDHPVTARRATLIDDSIDDLLIDDIHYDITRRHNTERGKSVPMSTQGRSSPVKSILVTSPLKTKKKVEFGGVDEYDDEAGRYVRISDSSPLKARIMERKNSMERRRSRVFN